MKRLSTLLALSLPLFVACGSDAQDGTGTPDSSLGGSSQGEETGDNTAVDDTGGTGGEASGSSETGSGSTSASGGSDGASGGSSGDTGGTGGDSTGGTGGSTPDPECSAGETQPSATSCGPNANGLLQSVCTDGAWTDGSECEGAGACLNDETRAGTATCGFNSEGVLEQLCTGGSWSDTNQCVDPDLCFNTDVRAGSTTCGNNLSGALRQICLTGAWEDTPNCVGDDECQTGSVVAGSTACGFNPSTGLGRYEMNCIDGSWEDDLSTCIGDVDECVTGDEQVGSPRCGFNNSGYAEQVCNDGRWVNDGNCWGAVGECTNGNTQLGFSRCGFNDSGFEQQTCANGFWSNDGTCLGADICENGDRQGGSTTCEATGSLNLVCVDGSWGESSTCVGGLLWYEETSVYQNVTIEDIVVDSAGNTFMCGSTLYTMDGSFDLAPGRDAFVRAYDASGNLLWNDVFGGTGGDDARGITIDRDGNILVVGHTTGDLDGNGSAGGYDAFIRAYSVAGETMWTHQFGTSSDEGATDIVASANGFAYVVGHTSGALVGSNLGGFDYFVKLFFGSQPTSTFQYGTSANDFAYGVALDTQGKPHIGGSTSGTFSGKVSSGGVDMFVQKLSTDGSTSLFVQQFGSIGDDNLYGMTSDDDGNIIVVGSTTGPIVRAVEGSSDVYVRSHQMDGTVSWEQQFGTSSTDNAYAVTTDADGNVYVVGAVQGDLAGSGFGGGRDPFLRKYNSSGVEQWTEQWGTDLNEEAHAVAYNGVDGIIVGHNEWVQGFGL